MKFKSDLLEVLWEVKGIIIMIILGIIYLIYSALTSL